MTHQLGILLQAGVHVPRELFAVGVHVDAFARGLLQKVLEIGQVMARHHDARPCLDPLRNRGGLGLSENLDVRIVEELHGAQVHTAAFQDHLQEGFDVEVDVGHRGKQSLLDEGIDLRIGLA